MGETLPDVSRRVERMRMRQDEHHRRLTAVESATADHGRRLTAVEIRMFLICAGGGLFGSIGGATGVAFGKAIFGM